MRVVIGVLIAYAMKLWVNNRELKHALSHRPVELENLEVENEVLTRIVDRLDPQVIAKQTGFMVQKKEDIPKDVVDDVKKEIKQKVKKEKKNKES